MGKEYTTYFGVKTTKCVDEFEKRDEDGHMIYSRMILKDFMDVPYFLSLERADYWKYGFALIVRRCKGCSTQMSFSQLMKNKHNTQIYKEFDKLLRNKEFVEKLFNEKKFYFDDNQRLYFRAQSSVDRSGFYKEWHNGVLYAEKNYGECSCYYEAIGIKLYKRI